MIDAPQNLNKFAVAWHPQLPEAEKEAGKIQCYLKERHNITADVFCLKDTVFRKYLREGAYDLVIALGGDGTMIRTGKLCAPMRIPVMGINMGNVGFLIEVQKQKWQTYIDALIAGNWKIEKRMMLSVKHLRDGACLNQWNVLNDAVTARGRELRPIHFSVSISDAPLAEYVADGLIVASPTGSTAYAMAVSGPVLQPEMRNMLLLPIAPHLCMDRCLVLAEGEKVEIELTGYIEALFSPDGNPSVPLKIGDKIVVTASDLSAYFVRFIGERGFYRKLTESMRRGGR